MSELIIKDPTLPFDQDLDHAVFYPNGVINSSNGLEMNGNGGHVHGNGHEATGAAHEIATSNSGFEQELALPEDKAITPKPQALIDGRFSEIIQKPQIYRKATDESDAKYVNHLWGIDANTGKKVHLSYGKVADWFDHDVAPVPDAEDAVEVSNASQDLIELNGPLAEAGGATQVLWEELGAVSPDSLMPVNDYNGLIKAIVENYQDDINNSNASDDQKRQMWGEFMQKLAAHRQRYEGYVNGDQPEDGAAADEKAGPKNADMLWLELEGAVDVRASLDEFEDIAGMLIAARTNEIKSQELSDDKRNEDLALLKANINLERAVLRAQLALDSDDHSAYVDAVMMSNDAIAELAKLQDWDAAQLQAVIQEMNERVQAQQKPAIVSESTPVPAPVEIISNQEVSKADTILAELKNTISSNGTIEEFDALRKEYLAAVRDELAASSTMPSEKVKEFNIASTGIKLWRDVFICRKANQEQNAAARASFDRTYDRALDHMAELSKLQGQTEDEASLRTRLDSLINGAPSQKAKTSTTPINPVKPADAVPVATAEAGLGLPKELKSLETQIVPMIEAARGALGRKDQELAKKHVEAIAAAIKRSSLTKVQYDMVVGRVKREVQRVDTSEQTPRPINLLGRIRDRFSKARKELHKVEAVAQVVKPPKNNKERSNTDKPERHVNRRRLAVLGAAVGAVGIALFAGGGSDETPTDHAQREPAVTTTTVAGQAPEAPSQFSIEETHGYSHEIQDSFPGYEGKAYAAAHKAALAEFGPDYLEGVDKYQDEDGEWYLGHSGTGKWATGVHSFLENFLRNYKG